MPGSPRIVSSPRSPRGKAGEASDPGRSYLTFALPAKTREFAFRERVKQVLDAKEDDLHELRAVYSAAFDLERLRDKTSTFLIERELLDKVRKRILGVIRRRLKGCIVAGDMPGIKATLEDIDSDVVMVCCANITEVHQARALVALEAAMRSVQALEMAIRQGEGKAVAPEERSSRLKALQMAIADAKYVRLEACYIQPAEEVAKSGSMRCRLTRSLTSGGLDPNEVLFLAERTLDSVEIALVAATKGGDPQKLRVILSAAKEVGLTGLSVQAAEARLTELEPQGAAARGASAPPPATGAAQPSSRTMARCASSGSRTFSGPARRTDSSRSAANTPTAEGERGDLEADSESGSPQERGRRSPFFFGMPIGVPTGPEETLQERRVVARHRLQEALALRRVPILRSVLTCAEVLVLPDEELRSAQAELREMERATVKLKADLQSLLDKIPISFDRDQETLSYRAQRLLPRLVALVQAANVEVSLRVHVHEVCAPKHLPGQVCTRGERGSSGLRAQAIRAKLLEAGWRGSVLTKGWGCQHPKVGAQSLVRIVPGEPPEE